MCNTRVVGAMMAAHCAAYQQHMGAKSFGLGNRGPCGWHDKGISAVMLSSWTFAQTLTGSVAV